MKYLGIDYGSKRIGTALSDPDGVIAFPNRVVSADGAVRREITALVTEENVAEIVVGLPLGRDGQDGPAAVSVRAFADRLTKWFGLPVHLWDERHTTAQARHVLNRPEKGQADLVAATLILQSWLDSRRSAQS